MYSNSRYGFDSTRICFAQFASLGLYFKKIYYFFKIHVSRFSNMELLSQLFLLKYFYKNSCAYTFYKKGTINDLRH
jgi:hypothetical protein